MRRVLAGAATVASAALIAACGSTSGTIPRGYAATLQTALARISSDLYQNECAIAAADTRTAQADLTTVPDTVDPRLGRNLSDGLTTLAVLVHNHCGGSTGSTGTTGTTGTTSTTGTTGTTSTTGTTGSTTTTTTTTSSSATTTAATTSATTTAATSSATTTSGPGNGGTPGNGDGNGNGNDGNGLGNGGVSSGGN